MRISFLVPIAAAGLITFASARAGAAEESPAPAAAAPSTSKSESPDEVTIRARRAQLARSVSRFVDQIAARENAEGLPRWNLPVCPLVTGLPRQEGEFILERVSEVARAAQVPLAAEHCQPNLYIVVTPDPKKALEGMTYRLRQTVFGGTNASVVHDFIATPRGVRVWYNSEMTDSLGAPPGVLLPCTIGPACGVPIFNNTIPTHLSFNRIWNFWRVIVIVDQTRLRAVSHAQFADYAAMVGLAEIRPDARLDDADTILKLFDAPPGVAPAAMTDWDRAFLKGLYATEQKSKGQRGEIAHTILREIAE